MATPRSLAPCLRIAAQSAISAALLLLTQCVSSYEVLGAASGGVGSTGGSAGMSQGGNTAGGRASLPPWTDCNDALALGADGDPCVGPFPNPCQTPLRDCCRTVVTCSANGVLNVDPQCEPCPCALDIDCGPGAWCTDGRCRACAVADTCRIPFAFVDRNGCAYCLPPTKCRDDSDCSAGQRCYSGQTCLPGCAEDDRTCCYGNGCAAPGCGTTAGLDCSLVGCPDGSYCDLLDLDHECACTSSGWRCAAQPPNICRPL